MKASEGIFLRSSLAEVLLVEVEEFLLYFIVDLEIDAFDINEGSGHCELCLVSEGSLDLQESE